MHPATVAEWTSLRDPLLERARSHANRNAFVLGDARVTFGELAERAAARGAALQRRGVRQGDRVALVLPTGVPLIETFWATQLIGAVPCILNPSAPPAILHGRIGGLKPRLVLGEEEARTLTGAGGGLIEPELGADDPSYLQLTSGTSGEPRAAIITHRNSIAWQRARGRTGQVIDGDVLVNWMPPWHDFGLVCFFISAVYFGLECHLLEPEIRVLPQWLSTIAEVGGTNTGAPDFAYKLAVRMVDPRRADLSSLRAAFDGGEPVRWSTIEHFETAFSVPGVILPAYGLAEATAGVTSHVPGDEIVVDARGNVSCGKPVGDVEVKAGTSVEAPAEILARGEAIFSGYFEADDDTRARLHDGWLHTGDSGYIDDEGRLFVLGRRTTLIKRGGGVIAPREIEEAAHRAEGVRIAAAVGLPTARGDDELVVVVERRGDEPRERLAPAVSRSVLDALGFAPNRIVVVEPRTIPRSETGKIRYGPLHDALLAGTIG